ncbi:carbonic anhydrase 2-like isoform X2 [Planococcus citri]|uniref:carbonic anhydrase 2-like isoform X2 n=1 Tax=Planococcus citri TaxID=170843 RepID=UPI0031F77E53
MEVSWHIIFLCCTIIEFVLLESEADFFNIPYTKDDKKFPMNVNSTNSVDHFNLTQIIITIILDQKVEIKKTNELVKATLAEPIKDSRVEGGVFKNDRYLLKEIIFFWTDDTNESAATIVDGENYPLQPVLIFMNDKYDSFEKALDKEDGLAMLNFLVGICREENKKFESNEKALKKLQSQTVAESNLNTVTKWFVGEGLGPNTTYYAYPGPYIDKSANKRYYCATVVTFPNAPQQCLSSRQFKDTFGSFTNNDGMTLTNEEPASEQTKRIVKSKGVKLNSKFS